MDALLKAGASDFRYRYTFFNDRVPDTVNGCLTRGGVFLRPATCDGSYPYCYCGGIRDFISPVTLNNMMEKTT